MARKITFDETAALDAAMRAFWSRGYEGTSINDLEQATGLKRTSLYNTYGNKRALFEKAIEHYQQTHLAEMAGLLYKGKNIRENIKNFMRGAIALHFSEDSPQGCLVILSVLERDQHDQHTGELLERIIQQLHALIYERLKDAQDNGEISDQFDTRDIATTIVAVAAGSIVMARADFKQASLNKISDVIDMLLSK